MTEISRTSRAGGRSAMGPKMCLLAGAALAMIGCGGGPGPRDVVSPDEVPGGQDPPKIGRITDLGDVARLPDDGPLPAPDSDDRFVLGELVLVEGSGFGKQPVVRVGGVQAAVLARTGSGGIVCRIPAGVEAGTIEVVVSHGGGRDATNIAAERQAVLIDAATGQVHIVAIGKDASEVTLRATLPIPGAVDAAVSPDGQAAYVAANPTAATAGASLHVISLTAAGKPKLVRTVHLEVPQVSALALAERASLGAVIGAGKLVLIDLRAPGKPRALPAFPLVGEAIAVAVHPDGSRVAVLSPHDNLLTPIDLANRESPKVERAVDLLPGEAEPLAVDVEFAPGGEAWALLGDGPKSLASGVHPARLVAVSWETGEPRVHRTVVLETSGAPVGLGVGRRPAPSTAAAARDTRKAPPVVVATVHRQLFASDPEFAPSRQSDLGEVLTADLDGRTQLLSRQTAVFGDPVVSHDLLWVVTPTLRILPGVGGTNFELGLSFDPLPGAPGVYRFAKVADATPAGLKVRPGLAVAP